jgi:hypothetical protein
MPTDDSQDQAGFALLLLAVLAVFGVAIAYHAPNKLDHDVSYFLAVSQLVNNGDQLYVDLIDFNTPAAVFIGQLSDWISNALHAPLDQTHKGVLLVVAAIGLALCFAVLFPLLRKLGLGRWCIAIGLPAAILFATPAIGGREHLAMIGLMPWVLSTAMEDRARLSPILSIALGIAAGCAMLLKPHFVAFGLTIGLVELVRNRGRLDRLSLATWTAGIVSISLYLGLFLLVPTYLGEMFPFSSETFGRLSSDRLQAAASLVMSGKPIATLVLIYILARPASGLRFFSLPVVVAVVFIATAIAIYIFQGFSFPYQLLPVKIALAVCTVFLLAQRLSGKSASFSSLPGPRTALVLATVTFGLVMSWPPDVLAPYPKRQDMLEEPLLAALTPPRKGDAILVISTAVDPASEFLTYLDVEWSAPVITFFPIPALIRQNGRSGIDHPPPPNVREHWTEWFRDRAARRFAAKPPVRVAVEISDRQVFFEHSGFDLLAWLREDQAFDSAWQKAGLEKIGPPIEWNGRIYQMYAATT